MAGAVDFNYIFFGRHERHHKIITASVLVLVAVIAAFYAYSPAAKQQPIQQEQKELLMEFIKSSLRAEFLPSSVEVSRLTTSSGVVYNASWAAGSTRFAAGVRYNSLDDKKIKAVQVTTFLERNTAFTGNDYKLIAMEFFPGLWNNWNCKKSGATTICESILLKGKDKKVAGVMSPVRNRTGTIFYVCMIPAGSEIYNNRTCISA